MILKGATLVASLLGLWQIITGLLMAINIGKLNNPLNKQHYGRFYRNIGSVEE